MALIEENTPKHTITNSEVFQKAREQLGHLILKNMDITGGTDVDWLIERKGGFIILESKLFREEHVTIPVGQMIAFESLYERLSSGGKCYFYLFANEENTDFTNPESPVWYFEMSEWKKKKIPQNKTKTGKYYRIKKDVMAKIPIKHFRILMEHHWKEFDKKKIDLKPKLQRSTSKISKKEKAYSVKEVQKTYPKAYEKWTESDDEFLKKFWKENKQSTKEKIQELMQKFGRNRGAITSRLSKMGFDLDNDLKTKTNYYDFSKSKKENAIIDAMNFLLKKYTKCSTKNELLFKTKEMLRGYHHLGEERIENYLKIALSDLKVSKDFDLDKKYPRLERI